MPVFATDVPMMMTQDLWYPTVDYTSVHHCRSAHHHARGSVQGAHMNLPSDSQGQCSGQPWSQLPGNLGPESTMNQ
jgi:hypothetical protein